MCSTGVSKHYRTTFSIPGWPGVGHWRVVVRISSWFLPFHRSVSCCSSAAEIAWYGVHFKAIPTDPPSCAKREAQAMVIRAMVVDDLVAGREVVITGDFNDFSGTDIDQQGNVPTSHVLRILQVGDRK